VERSSEAGAEADVRLSGVRKVYGAVVAVDRVDLDIRRGEFFTMLGPSGSGKTTMLRMIAGFELPDEGRVELAGTDVTDLAAYDRDVNTVFQDYALFPHMTVGDNVEYGLRVAKIGREERRKRRAEALGMVRLPGYDDRKPNELSGGQRQRVALARAIVNQPRVLLLDEPLGALDLKLREQLQIELKQIQREVGITFVYVTHDQEEALTMSDRIAVMNRGIVEQVAEPVEVYERPATTFVAGFIGVSNLMPGVVRSLSGDKAEVDLEAGVTVSATANGLATSEQCHAVVRPEKLFVAKRGEAPPQLAANAQSVDGVVASSVYLGTATQLVVELRGGSRMTVLCPNTDESERQSLPGGGAEVTLSWTPEHIHLVRESDSERATADHEALAMDRSEAA